MKKILFTLLAMALNAGSLTGISLPAVFSDHMVLQQNEMVSIWGWGKPLEKVSVSVGWSQETIETVVDNQAHWEIKVQTPQAGGPYSIKISGYNEINIQNVLIGEVWICSGQSNMEWSARMGIDSAALEISRANYPNIRFFSVVHRTATSPQIDLEGSWKVCSPETMIDFSALAYFFAQNLQADLKVPIGLINSSWGGTPAEVWSPEEAIAADPILSSSAELLPEVAWCPKEPGRVYNAMIAPFTRFKIAGAIWYQGEANTANPLTYKELLSTLIESWRAKWGYPFPFYYAQIAPFSYGGPLSGALVRDAQRRALQVPNTGMVVTSDIGNIYDIHPGNKQEVGRRLANLALAGHYKTTDRVVSGPLYQKMVVEKKEIRLFFDHAEGLHTPGGAMPSHFEIAGNDKVFRPAIARIEANTVVVFSLEIRTPLAVRFAWSNTADPNLFNGAGLPTSCFRTDDWELR